jgi:Domain of unknown function (DUF4129)
MLPSYRIFLLTIILAVCLGYFLPVTAQESDSLSTVGTEEKYARDSADNKQLSSKKRNNEQVEKRSFDESALDEFRSDKDFVYDKTQAKDYSMMDMFRAWLNRLLFDLFTDEKKWTIFKTSLSILSAIAVFYALVKLAGLEIPNWWRKKGSSINLNAMIAEENIHGIDFEKALIEAIKQSNYRLAVRILYLASLKKLSDNELIHWQIEKTNADYCSELSKTNLKTDFQGITAWFEYAWYGNFTIDQATFEQARKQFNHFQDKIRNK